MDQDNNPIDSWILGSASKWRQAIFKEHFQSDLFAVADIDEKAIRHPRAEIMTQLIARAKADEILRLNQEDSNSDRVNFKNNVLVCCDQVIRFNGKFI